MNLTDFDLAVTYVLKNEGGLEDDPNDPGGITKFGISLRFLKNLTDPKKYGFSPETINRDTIEHLTLDQAKALYKGEFWDHAPFATINRQEITNYLFDMVINEGISPAVKCIQRACWSVMKKRNYIADDGILGNATLDLINQTAIYLMAPLRSERASYYRLLVEQNPQRKEDLEGWLNRAYG